MRRQIVTGKLSCLQTMTELELRISFVQSMCLGLALWTFPLCINTVLSKAFHYLFIVTFSLLLLPVFTGTRRSDGFLGMDKQNHLLEGWRRRLLFIGRDLGKRVGMVTLIILKTYLRKGSMFKLQVQKIVFLLQELVFHFHLEDLIRFSDSFNFIVSFFSSFFLYNILLLRIFIFNGFLRLWQQRHVNANCVRGPHIISSLFQL